MRQNNQYELDSCLQRPLNESFKECIKGLSSPNAEEKQTLLNKLNNLVDTNLMKVLTDNKLSTQLENLEKVDAKHYPSIAFYQKLSALKKSTGSVNLN